MFQQLRVIITLGLLTLLLSGCGGLGSKPTASIRGAKLAGLSLDGVRIDFDVNVKNPSRESLTFTSLNYALTNSATGGDPFIEGVNPQAAAALSVPARSSKSLTVPAVISFPQLLEALDQAQPGSVVPYRAEFALLTSPTLLGNTADNVTPQPLALPMSFEGKFPVPNLPEVELTDLSWEEPGLISIRGNATLRIKNTNQFPVDLRSFGYSVQLAGATLASGGLGSSTRFAPGQTRDIQIPLRLSALKLGAAVLDSSRKGTAALRLKGNAKIETEFGPLGFNFDKSGM
jgi:LEA14-like dessication related protein